MSPSSSPVAIRAERNTPKSAAMHRAPVTSRAAVIRPSHADPLSSGQASRFSPTFTR